LGELVDPNGDVYYGSYHYGKKQGNGKLTTKDFTYNGVFEDGLFQGYGIYNDKNSELKYTGYFFRNLYHGEGEIEYKSGDTYYGEFFQGKRNGRGVANWKNGQFYEGSWFNNKQDGYGELITAEGVKYEGFWK